ncbi:uncharacterized protein LOC133193190 [Saccostrea echinata]|uniref:uncharacterized protein LOC133193190 n=1 Tax=Saccostrea echinata TaxID=191078 RepID=UPI002A8183C2|nr:uncharacterized protein LOC133193190 [Saccostrea echinata]
MFLYKVVLILTFLIQCRAIHLRKGSYNGVQYPKQYAKNNFCAGGRPVTFRFRYGASIPNCDPPLGPIKGCEMININIYTSRPYHCPNKGYVSGYSAVPMDIHGSVMVKCCKALGVTYNEKECVQYFREEDPKHPSPTKPGYYLVGSTPLFLPKGKVGFYNKECRFRRSKGFHFLAY